MGDNKWHSMLTENKKISQIIRSEVILSIHAFFKSRKYVLVDPPVLHERIANKKYEIYLSELDGQYSLNSSNGLFLSAYASLYERVYAISPTFRIENETINHLVEFRMLEVEAVNMTFDEMVNFIIELIQTVLNELLNSEQVSAYPETELRIKKLYKEFKPELISYNDFMCSVKLSEEKSELGEIDISEADYLFSKYLEKPVIITDYPVSLASWTAKRKDCKTSYALNLLLPQSYGELCEGCERTTDVNLLQYKFNCAKIYNLNWYVEAVNDMVGRRCGFGLGIDRLVRWIVGSDRIDETVFFPRKIN